jgi:hypothetical protein
MRRSGAAPGIVIAGLGVLIAACQAGTGGPSSSATPTAATSVSTAAPTPTPLPIAMPRPTDIPSDGSCGQGDICLGILQPAKVYRTTAFSPQLTFTMPEAGWENLADVGGIFQLLPIAYPGDAIAFFRDPTASGALGTRVEDLAAWLAKNPLLTVTPTKPVTVGGLKGLTMDITIAAGARNHPVDCPVQVCVPIFSGKDSSKVPTWKWDWGAAGLDTQRLYLVRSKEGVVAIFVDSLDGTTFDSLNKTADKVLATLRFS